MPKDLHRDETFLARWLASELSTEELQSFKKSKDYEIYEKIASSSQLFFPPAFNKEDIEKQILQKTRQKLQKKTRKHNFSRWLSIAASILIIMGSYLFFIDKVEYIAGKAEHPSFTLADGTVVHLNADSKVTYTRWNWYNEKKIKLIGEAFFKVKKGDKFHIKTNKGIVSVLGTNFNVKSRMHILEVNCYEGKVQVTIGREQFVIIENENVKVRADNLIEKWEAKDESPAWTVGESRFRRSKLELVIKELEIQFNIVIDYSAIDKDIVFTGSFTHDNLTTALKTVFKPTNISYKFEDDGKIKLSSP